jgi:hypothetical protein
MQEKLRRSGLRSLGPVVDVTNYILLELGQPMHAFDLARLDGYIEVRMARPGERLRLLDGREMALNGETLVVADATKVLAIAGVMGGEGAALTRAPAICSWSAPSSCRRHWRDARGVMACRLIPPTASNAVSTLNCSVPHWSVPPRCW